MLQCRGLGKKFGSRWLFRHLDLTVEPGECVVIQGPNGCGKSTLLKIMAGLMPPTEGTCDTGEDSRTTLGYASLDQAVYPGLTVNEHLVFAAQMRGCEPRLGTLLGEVGLPDSGEVLGRQLSTGMRSRLKLALAIQAGPHVLLLDEPGAGLDQAGREMLERVLEARRSQTCLVIATNDPKETGHATQLLSLVS